MTAHLIFETFVLVVVLILARIFYLIHKITTGFSRLTTHRRYLPCKTIICVGSGGHTTEMLHILKSLDFVKYTPRLYLLADTDTTSCTKIKTLELLRGSGSYEIIEIPRSRIVGQSYLTSIFTTLYSTLYSIPLVFKTKPDLILCNGPGTCIPICILGFAMKVAFITDTRIVYVESFCRTKTFSLSGKILMYIADNFIVQWPSLKRKLKRAEYIGKLM